MRNGQADSLRSSRLFPGQFGDDACDRRARGFQALAGVDDEIGPPALLRIGHLLGQDRREFFLASCPAAPARAARWISAGAVTTTTLSTRSRPPVSNSSGMSSTHDRRAGGAIAWRGTHRRRRAPADGRSLPASSAPSASPSTLLRQSSARSTTPSTTVPGKRRLDQRRRLAGIEAMHRLVGIVDRHAGLREHLRRRRLAHADRAGEAEHDHRFRAPDRRRSAARSSAVTCGADAEPVLETGHRLMQQHAEAVDRLQPALRARRRAAAFPAAHRRCR